MGSVPLGHDQADGALGSVSLPARRRGRFVSRRGHAQGREIGRSVNIRRRATARPSFGARPAVVDPDPAACACSGAHWRSPTRNRGLERNSASRRTGGALDRGGPVEVERIRARLARVAARAGRRLATRLFPTPSPDQRERARHVGGRIVVIGSRDLAATRERVIGPRGPPPAPLRRSLVVLNRLFSPSPLRRRGARKVRSLRIARVWRNGLRPHGSTSGSTGFGGAWASRESQTKKKVGGALPLGARERIATF